MQFYPCAQSQQLLSLKRMFGLSAFTFMEDVVFVAPWIISRYTRCTMVRSFGGCDSIIGLIRNDLSTLPYLGMMPTCVSIHIWGEVTFTDFHVSALNHGTAKLTVVLVHVGAFVVSSAFTRSKSFAFCGNNRDDAVDSLIRSTMSDTLARSLETFSGVSGYELRQYPPTAGDSSKKRNCYR